jgi:molecular chaperone GrpE
MLDDNNANHAAEQFKKQEIDQTMLSSKPGQAGQTAKASKSDPTFCSQCEEYKAGWQRAVADYRNLQKETQDKRAESALDLKILSIAMFLPVYENLLKAFAHMPEGESSQWSSWGNGLRYVVKQFEDILESLDVQRIKTVGERFDPSVHEAVQSRAALTNEADGYILEEVEPGFKIGDRILKPAKVIVSSNS